MFNELNVTDRDKSLLETRGGGDSINILGMKLGTKLSTIFPSADIIPAPYYEHKPGVFRPFGESERCRGFVSDPPNCE